MNIVELQEEDNLGLYCKNGKDVYVSSRKVAEIFEKEHKHVLEAIRSVECSDKFSQPNFRLSEYKVRGKQYPEYLLTKDGFTFLVMGFTGEKAARFKEAYIVAFNGMYNLINTRQFARLHYAPMTDAIQDYYERNDKKIESYSYSNEANMINKIVLGLQAKQYRVANNIPEDMETRDFIPKDKLEIIDKLEISNTELLNMDLDYDIRKSLLTKRCNNLLIDQQLVLSYAD